MKKMTVAPKITKAVPPAKLSQDMEVNMIAPAPDTAVGRTPRGQTSSPFSVRNIEEIKK
jgi:hypothetical protein